MRPPFQFCSMWIFPWIKLSRHCCSMWDKLGCLINSGNFFVRGYLPLIQKDYITDVHDLAVYVKEGLPFAQDLSLENSADSYLCFWVALLHSVSYFFFLYWSPLHFLILFHLTKVRFSQSNHLLMCLFLETLKSIIMTG